MILNLNLDYFMGFTGTINFFPHSLITGKNGSHKTTLMHGVAFAFCGTDAWGNRCPVHLISSEAEKLTVKAIREDIEVTRTLDRNKKTTLKVVVRGVPSPMNQTQLSVAVGEKDQLLSLLNPPYFFTLPDERKKEVLSCMVPEIDRCKLLEKITGLAILPEIELILAGKSYPQAMREITDMRRDAEKRFHVLSGSLEQREKDFKSLLADFESRRFSTKEDEDALKIEINNKVWWENEKEKYDLKAKHLRDNKDNLEKSIQELGAEIEAQNKTLLELKDKLSESEDVAVAARGEIEMCEEIMAQARSTLRTLEASKPKPPESSPSIHEGVCPHCGQMVGKRHIEMVKKNMEKAQDAYVKEKQLYDESVASIRKDMEKLAENHRMVEVRNGPSILAPEKIQREIASGQAVVATLTRQYNEKVRLRDQGAYLGEPAVNFSEKRIAYLKQKLDGTWNSVEKARITGELERAKHAVEEGDSATRACMGRLSYFKQMEEGMKQLPSAEMESLKNVVFGDFMVDFSSKGIVTSTSGLPFSMLSKGEKMAAGILIAIGLHKHLPSCFGTIFIDDCEMMDEERYFRVVGPALREGVQILEARVGGAGLAVKEVRHGE